MIKKIVLSLIFQAKRIFFSKERHLRSIGVRVGEGCEIYTSINNFGSEPWLVSIGRNTTITHGVVFITHDGSSRIYRKKYEFLNQTFGNKFSPISVGNNSFVGLNTILMPGITIGDNVIVGAGAVVTKDIPSGSVAAGNPAKVLNTIEKHQEESIKEYLPLVSKNRADLKKELLDIFQSKNEIQKDG